MEDRLRAKEVRRILREELYEKFLKKRYGYSKMRVEMGEAIRIYRFIPIGFDKVGFGLDTKWLKLGGGINKRIEAVEEIVGEVNDKIPLNPPYDKYEETFGEAMIYKGKEFGDNEVDTRDKLEEAIGFLKRYYEEVGEYELERFNDIREIDKIVNDLDDFWDDDWKKPYGLGGRFDLRRIIIAKLSGNPRYEELVERIYDFYDDLREKRGLPKDDRNDLSLAFNYTVHLLKGVKPLYDKYE